MIMMMMMITIIMMNMIIMMILMIIVMMMMIIVIMIIKFNPTEDQNYSVCDTLVNSCNNVRKALSPVERLSGQCQEHLWKSERKHRLC